MSDLNHIGVPRRSGRYPWGSGKDPQQRNKSFLGRIDELEKQGLTQVQVAEALGLNTTQLREKRSTANAEEKKADYAMALRLKDKGCSYVEIGKRMGRNESSIRAMLKPANKERMDINETVSNVLKDEVYKKKYIDVGLGVERHLDISRTKLKIILSQLEENGYKVHKFSIEQLGTGKKTNMMTLTKNDVDYKDMMINKHNVQLIGHYSDDGGRTLYGIETPRSVSSDRVMVRYHEDGGSEKDGVIELRRGVDDISLGNSKYAQVRVAVDDTHFLKGMAVYADNMPKGTDIIYNTNKSKVIPKQEVFKGMKDDKDNPFGATVRQKHYIDSNGKKQLSALNMVNEEGEWRDKWSKSLSSQMLSKQTPTLAKKQLGLAFDLKKEEFDTIQSLTNPVVKKKLLESFSNDCDSSAVHLKAAALPRTGWHVLLPISKVKENEIYAPNYKDGEKVVLIRYPHGGIFEIPELTVNNRNSEARAILQNEQGHAKDAVGIHHKVAERLSGADFDGDAVLVIPNNNKDIKHEPPLKGLINFDPKISYAPYHGMRTIDGGTYDSETRKVDYGGNKPKTQTKQMKMGDISNLITDMTIKGSDPRGDEIARAVKHSMVVIDSEKHSLNYKQSYLDQGIAALKKKYQGSERSGASTLISRASSDIRVDARKENFKIDPATGKKVYTNTGERNWYTNQLKKIKSTKMNETEDALSLSSGTPIETIYALHANKLKALANEARKTSINVAPIPSSKTAKTTFTNEIATLQASLNVALKNKPLERRAQGLANQVIASKKIDNPDMTPPDLKKIKGQALIEMRNRVGASKHLIEISDREWEAIQSGAVSTNVLMQILNNTDLDKVKQRSMPRSSTSASPAQTARIKSMIATGYTQSEIAEHLGVSTSTIAKTLS